MDSTHQDSNDQHPSDQQVIQEEEQQPVSISEQNNETDQNQETIQINTSTENDTQSTTHRIRNYRDLPQEKKLFVGGLPANITLQEFNAYFRRFGTITDSVVILDKVTRIPRGFGFVSFDSIDSVDAVLQNTFHYLKHKRVEVVKAVLVPEPRNNNNNNHHDHDHNQASTTTNDNPNPNIILTHHQALQLGPASYYYGAVPQYYYDPGLSKSQLYSYGLPRYLINNNNNNNNNNNVPYCYYDASNYQSGQDWFNYGCLNNNYGYYKSYNPSYLVLP